MKVNLVGGLLALVAGCSDTTSPPDPPIVTIVPATTWSGGEVELASAAFTTTTLPVLVVGAETLSVHRTGDSSVAARLPLGPSGSVLIELALGHRRYALGAVDRVGYREYRDLAPAFFGELVTTSRGGTPIIVGTGIPTTTSDGEVQYLDLGSMTMTSVPGLYGSSYYGVSPTFRTDQFVLLDSARTAAVWQLWPSVTKTDTAPNLGLVRHLARLSDSVWLRTGAHASQAYVNHTAVFGVLGLPTESVWSVILSPTGATATIAVDLGTPGVPVFSTASGDTLYTLGAGFRHAGWAAYSPDGASLYFLAGAGSASNDSLIRINAATGAVAAGISLTSLTMIVATDPVRSLVYVESLADSTPTILVLDATTLAEVGRLPSPALAGGPRCSFTCFEGAIAVDRRLNRLHVVWIDPRPGSTSSPIWTFDLLP